MDKMDDATFLTRQNQFGKTDLRSLRGQIKAIINKAKEVAEEELNCRRARLKTLLTADEQKFQTEFADRVRHRIEQSFAERREILFKTNEERKKEKAQFLEKKAIQKQAENSWEFREKMTQHQIQMTKESQLHQMLENEHKRRREKDLNQYWQHVAQVNANRYADEQKIEQELQRQIKENVKCELLMQMYEKKNDPEMIREKLEDSKRMTELRRQILLEYTDSKFKRTSPEALARGQEQRDDIERRRKLRLAEECEAINDHRKLIEEIQAELNKDTNLDYQRKKDLKKTMLEFIAYVKRVRADEAMMQKLRDDRAADLNHVDFCTKNSEKERKKSMARDYFSDLRCQVHEECWKRRREEEIYNDRAIIENRFAREEIVDPVGVAQKKRQYCRELDQQILETKKVWAEELAAYERLIKSCDIAEPDADKLMEALEKNSLCHPNWKIFVCQKNRLDEVKEATKAIKEEDIPPEGRIEMPSRFIDCDNTQKCALTKNCTFSFTS